jgi:hypothetical protein
MPRITYTVEHIITTLREAEVALSKGQTVVQVSPAPRDHRTDVLPVAERVWRAENRSGQAAQGVGAGEYALKTGRSRAHTRQGDPERGHREKLLSPARRRQTVEHGCATVGLPERRACRVLGQPRSTQRHHGGPSDDDVALTTAIIRLAREYGRYGYRRITV